MVKNLQKIQQYSGSEISTHSTNIGNSEKIRKYPNQNTNGPWHISALYISATSYQTSGKQIKRKC